jgi:hypothetical protein
MREAIIEASDVSNMWYPIVAGESFENGCVTSRITPLTSTT